MNFDVKTEKLSDGQYVISLSGEVDLYTAPEFKQQLLEVIEQGGRDVIVDLSNTTFIDSTTLGVLVGGVKRLRTNEGSSHSSAATETSRRSSRSPASTASLRFTRRSRLPSARDLPPRVQLRGLAGACAVLIAAIAATGCGTTGLPEAGSGDATQGKVLFKAKCGQCHTLADAGTNGVIGPNLDDAFRQSRADGLGDLTVQSVVRDQICVSRGASDDRLHRGCRATSSPATMQTRSRLYVASVAGLPVRPQPGAEAGGRAGREARHRTARRSSPRRAAAAATRSKAAGASGTVGPNLDDAKPPKELVIDRVTNGKGVMPSFKDSYSAEQIAAVADYVSKNAGK